MRYTIRAGMLYEENRQESLIHMKGIFPGRKSISVFPMKNGSCVHSFAICLLHRVSGQMSVSGNM